MKKKLGIGAKVFIAVLLAIFCVSCLDKKYEELMDEENKKISNYISGKGFTKLENGVYILFYNDTSQTDTVKPHSDQTIIVNYTGRIIEGELIETTNIDEEESEGRRFVYGPQRLVVGQIISGFDYAIRLFSEGDTGTIVIPSNQFKADYNPVVFHVGLKSIIQDDSLYADSIFKDYLIANSFNTDNVIPSSPGLYWKTASNTLNDTVIIGSPDSLKLELESRYAEKYYGSGLGRIFYPLNDEDNIMTRGYGSSFEFPMIQAIDSVLNYVEVGDEIEFACNYQWAFGTEGYYDEYTRYVIVPAYMPVHYKIKVVDKW